MWADNVPTAQKRSRRPRLPLQELRLQSRADTDHTSLTPLFRRLRLKDCDSTTSVTCTPRRPSSVILPCSPGLPRNDILLPSNSTTTAPQPCTIELSSSAILEPPRTLTLGPSVSEPLKCPIPESLSHAILEPPRSPTQGLCTLEFSSSSVKDSLCSPVLDPLDSIMPASLCNPVSDPSDSTVQTSIYSPVPALLGSNVVPVSLCSLVSDSLDGIMPASPHSPVQDPQGNSVPASPRSTVPDPQGSSVPASPRSPVPDPQGSSVPASPRSPVPDPQGSSVPASPRSPVPDPQGSSVPASPRSPVPDPQGSSAPASPCSAVPDPQGSSVPASPRSPVQDPQGSSVPASPCSAVPDPQGSSAPASPCSAVPDPQGSSVPASPRSPIPDPQGSSVPASPCSAVQDPQGSSVPASPRSLFPDPQGSGLPAFQCSLVQYSPDSTVPASMCRPVPAPLGNNTLPVSLCSPVPDLQSSSMSPSSYNSVPDPPDSSVPVSPCSLVPDPPGSSVPASPCSPVLGPSTMNVPSSTVLASLCNPNWGHCTLDFPGGTPLALLCSPFSDPASPWQHYSGSTLLPGPSVLLSGSPWQHHVPTVVASTSITPVTAVVASTSITPVTAVVASTSITPVTTAVASTSITPVSTAVASTSITPRELWERSMNTSMSSLICSKDSATQTDSLLWRLPQEQLKSLPRAELEGRLESCLIIIEALSLRQQDWQEIQRPLPSVGPAEQRDVLTQTDIAHPKGEEEIYRNLYLDLLRKMETLQRQRETEEGLQQELGLASTSTSTWRKQNLLLQGLVDDTFQSLQDEQRALNEEQEQVSWCMAVLAKVPGKLRSCLEERDAMRQRADEALRAKEEGDRFLEAFSAHVSTQISIRDQSLASQQELGTLLEGAIAQQTSLASEAQTFREFINITFEKLKEEREALDVEREQVGALVPRCQAMLERVPAKLRSCLEERDALRQQADEALQANKEMSCQLEETSVTLQDRVAQLEQLTAANSRLSEDLSSLMMDLANLKQEHDVLQQEHKMQQEEMAWLVRERDTLQQECLELRRDLREAIECREFLDQENRMSRTQLLEEEARLKSTQATLQEQNLQCEELMESQQRLWEEQAVLSKELESTKAELLDLQLKRNKVSWASTDISKSKLRLQELADCLRASLQEEDDNAPSSSRAWTPAPRTPGWQTPHRPVTPACRTPAYRTPYQPRSSFVGTILKAVSGRDADADEATGDGIMFTKDKPASALKHIEPEEGLLESVDALKAVVSDLAMLSYRIQEQEQNKFMELRKEISDLQHHLEKVTDESEEKIETQEATITKLNKKLRDKMESEKQLQDLVKQQDNKIAQLIDHSAEVKNLEAVVSQLKRLLQHAETEAKTLWQELRLQEPKVDTTPIQERILLRQQVDKLRQLMLDKDDEKWRISKKYMEQIKGLELKLHQVQKMLRTYEKLQEKTKEVLWAVPDITAACPELQSLLQQYLNLEPGSGEAAEL
ncbi:sperm-associated antigen 5 isoform X1 [Pogoniulus pusillus]|uniref:sperm-associated antigen 5 isoform X1 n=1 Tax=Pogoniulus pusillus TaxID=488313 RepID=UPI0030B9715B